jgi:DNA ligase 1
VIGHQDGMGKHKGRLGALLVKLADGTQFAVGTGFSDKERGAPPAVGATITFRYQELSEAGVPRFPSYVGVRTDAPKSSVVPAGPAATTSGKSAAARTKTVVAVPEKVSPSPAGEFRRFEYTDEKSNKFWEVAQSGCDVTTKWGRIGSAGQSKTKTFASEDAAQKQAEKLIEEKSEEGYEEV